MGHGGFYPQVESLKFGGVKAGTGPGYGSGADAVAAEWGPSHFQVRDGSCVIHCLDLQPCALTNQGDWTELEIWDTAGTPTLSSDPANPYLGTDEPDYRIPVSRRNPSHYEFVGGGLRMRNGIYMRLVGTRSTESTDAATGTAADTHAVCALIQLQGQRKRES